MIDIEKHKSYKYIYSPLVLGIALVIFAYVFFNAPELPGILVGLTLTALYADPRWEATPNLLHNILICGGIIILVSSLAWLFRLPIIKITNGLVDRFYEKRNNR